MVIDLESNFPYAFINNNKKSALILAMDS